MNLDLRVGTGVPCFPAVVGAGVCAGDCALAESRSPFLACILARGVAEIPGELDIGGYPLYELFPWDMSLSGDLPPPMSLERGEVSDCLARRGDRTGDGQAAASATADFMASALLRIDEVAWSGLKPTLSANPSCNSLRPGDEPRTPLDRLGRSEEARSDCR